MGLSFNVYQLPESLYKLLVPEAWLMDSDSVSLDYFLIRIIFNKNTKGFLMQTILSKKT